MRKMLFFRWLIKREENYFPPYLLTQSDKIIFMKIRASFFLLILGFAYLPLSAQLYHGVNTAAITSSGTQKSTNLNSQQWICEFNLNQPVLEMKAKMASFGFTANAEGNAVLKEVFYIDANALIQINVDFSQLGLQSGSSREEGNVNLPVEIRFNERQIRTQAKISQFRQNAQGIQMNLDIPLNLQEFGLAVNAKQAASFSDNFVLQVNQLNMKAR